MKKKKYIKHYLVTSANRGPDVYIELAVQIKDIITSRIRAITSAPSECFSVVYCDEPFSLSELRRLNTALRNLLRHYENYRRFPSNVHPYIKEEINSMRHWLWHLREAVKYTIHHNIWGGFGKKIHQQLTTTLIKLHGYIYNSPPPR